jgi:hypothetical protein
MSNPPVAASAWPVQEQSPSSIARRGCDCLQQHRYGSTHLPPCTLSHDLHAFFRQLVQSLLTLIACDNPPPTAAATQEALSAIHENLRELDALCRAAGAPFAAGESLEELEAQRDALAAQAAANNVCALCPARVCCLRGTAAALARPSRLLFERESGCTR